MQNFKRWYLMRGHEQMRMVSTSLQIVCVLLLQDLVQSCSRGRGEDSGGHVLRETTSRGLCGLVCPSRTGVCLYCSVCLFLIVENVREMVRARPQPHTWANGCARASPRVERHQLSSGCSVRVRAPAFGVRHWLARTHQVCLVPMKGRSLVMCYKCLCACVFGAVEARSSRTSVGSFTSFPARGPPSTSLTAPPLLATRFAPASRPLRSCVCSVPSVGGELHR